MPLKTPVALVKAKEKIKKIKSALKKAEAEYAVVEKKIARLKKSAAKKQKPQKPVAKKKPSRKAGAAKKAKPVAKRRGRPVKKK